MRVSSVHGRRTDGYELASGFRFHAGGFQAGADWREQLSGRRHRRRCAVPIYGRIGLRAECDHPDPAQRIPEKGRSVPPDKAPAALFKFFPSSPLCPPDKLSNAS